MADNDYSQYEEIELLRLLLQKQDRLIEVEEAVVEGLKAQLASIDESLSTLEVFSTNFSDFITAWQQANTAPPNPATRVTVTWGPPQTIPKGQ